MDDHPTDIDRSTVGSALGHFATALAPLVVALGRVLWRHPLDSPGVIVAGGAAVMIFVNALFLQASPHPAPMMAAKPRPAAPITTAVGAAPAPRPAARETTAAESNARSRTQVISDIQRELSRRGLFDGPVDGVYGARTDAAIRDFEQAAGLKNAQPDEALLRAIVRSPLQLPATTAAVTPATAIMPQIAPAMPRPAPLSRHASAAAATPASTAPVPPKPVPSSKRMLAVQRALSDYGYGQVKPSGVFGPETKAAIEQFERERNLPVSGQVSDRLTRELAVVTGRPLE